MNARSIAFSSCWGSIDFPAMTQHVEVGPVSRGVMLPYGSTPLPSITGGPLAFSTILCRPFHQGRLRFPCLSTTRRRNDRFTAFDVKHTTGLGPSYPPAAPYPCDRNRKPINPLPPILGQATSILGLSTLTRVPKVNICWPIPACLAPSHLDAGSNRRSSQTLRPLSGGILCPVGFTRFRYQSRMQR